MSADSNLQHPRIPNGSACAALLASGIGVCAFGAMVVLAETSSAAAGMLNLTDSVGPLSGKTAGGVAVWAVCWGVLHRQWADRQIGFRKVWWAALALIVTGFALTFPPMFGLFAH